ncbi:MAG: TraR/DksA family transcriptional regulator [Polaromonas sp.]
METYTAASKPHFVQLLAQREAQLQGQLHPAGGTEHPGTLADSHEVTDFKDVAAEQTQADMEGVRTEQAALELGQVQAARRRLANDTYGKCLECGDSIDLRRLLALAETPYCAACQTAYERRLSPGLRQPAL